MNVRKTVVLLTALSAVAALSGCARLSALELPSFELAHWLRPTSAPAQEPSLPIRFGVLTREGVPEPAPAPAGQVTEPGQWAVAGTFTGGMVGLGAGLAACTPAVLVPWVYPACVALTTLAGTAGGAVLGTAVGDQARSAGASPSPRAGAIHTDAATRARLRSLVVEKLLTTGAHAVDLGDAPALDGGTSGNEREPYSWQGVDTVIEVTLDGARWEATPAGSFLVTLSARSRRVHARGQAPGEGAGQEIVGSTTTTGTGTPTADALARGLAGAVAVLGEAISRREGAGS